MLFRHSPEMMTQHNEHMRGGLGTVTVKHMLKPDEMLGKGRLFAELTIPPGASVGLHRHEGDVEAYYILQGKGRYQNDDESFDVTAGDLTLPTLSTRSSGHGCSAGFVPNIRRRCSSAR